MKCWGSAVSGETCGRIRVFAYADLASRPDLSEVESILPNYPLIQDLSASGGYRKEIADFLVYACDLDSVGRLEPNPEAREAAYRGAAIYIRMAAEMFVARCVLQRKVGKWGKPGAMVASLRQGTVPRVKKRQNRNDLADAFQWIFDFGNVSAHPRVSERRLVKIKDLFPPVHGNVMRALSCFNTAARGVRWGK